MKKIDSQFMGEAVLRLHNHVESRDKLVKKKMAFTDVDDIEKTMYLNSIQKQIAETMMMSLIYNGYLVFVHDSDANGAEYVSGELRVSMQVMAEPEKICKVKSGETDSDTLA